MDTADILNPDPPPRTAEHCRSMLLDTVAALADQTGLELRPTTWYVLDTDPIGITVNLRAHVSAFMQMEVCGVISLSVEPGEWADCIAELLLFSVGKRMTGAGRNDIIRYNLHPEGWSPGEWIMDENGEWEMHTDPNHPRWRST